MISIFPLICYALVPVLLVYALFSEKRYRRVSELVERLLIEQEKTNFRLYVTEKRQKLLK